VNKHGTREIAEAFIEFVYTPEAQTVFYARGFRAPILVADQEATLAAVEASATAEPIDESTLDLKYPIPADLFTITVESGAVVSALLTIDQARILALRGGDRVWVWGTGLSHPQHRHLTNR